MNTIKWNDNQNLSSVLVMEQNHTQADTMPLEEFIILGGVEYYEGYYFSYAYNRARNKIDLITRFSMENAKNDVINYLLSTKQLQNEDLEALSTTTL